MPAKKHNLGKLVATYGIAPDHLQRAVFIAVLSFLFFLAMMFTFYVRQQFGYFMLATAFLLVYLVTLFSWIVQRKTAVLIFEDGIEYRKFSGHWDEIRSVSRVNSKSSFHLQIDLKNGKLITVPGSIIGLDAVEGFITAGIAK